MRTINARTCDQYARAGPGQSDTAPGSCEAEGYVPLNTAPFYTIVAL